MGDDDTGNPPDYLIELRYVKPSEGSHESWGFVLRENVGGFKWHPTGREVASGLAGSFQEAFAEMSKRLAQRLAH